MKIDSDAMFFARSVVIRFCVSDRELGIIVRATNRTFICGVTTWQAQKCNKDGREWTSERVNGMKLRLATQEILLISDNELIFGSKQRIGLEQKSIGTYMYVRIYTYM